MSSPLKTGKDARALRRVSSLVLNADPGSLSSTTSRRGSGVVQPLGTKTSRELEIVPDSEEERLRFWDDELELESQEGVKKVVLHIDPNVIELSDSSDEDEQGDRENRAPVVPKGKGRVVGDDTFLSNIPGGWPVDATPTKKGYPLWTRKVEISISASPTRSTPGRKKYPPSRRIIESSSSGSDREAEEEVDELDSDDQEETRADRGLIPPGHVRTGASRDVERSGMKSPQIPPTTPRRLTSKEGTTKKRGDAPKSVQYVDEIDSEEVDELEDDTEEASVRNYDDSVLELNEPRSARKPIRALPLLDPKQIPSPGPSSVRSRGAKLPLPPPSSRLTQKDAATPSKPKSSTGTGKTPRVSKKAQAAARRAELHDYAHQVFVELNGAVFKNGLPSDTSINWNTRLQATAGRAKYRRSREGVQTVEIELADKILTSEERIRHTLAHEMCHLASWVIDKKPSENHGQIFKAWGERVMRKRPDIKVTLKHDYEIDHPFTWRCKSCSKTYGRFSKSINAETDRCGACQGGILEPLFTTNRRGPPKTPKTSRLALASPQGSPISISKRPIAMAATSSSTTVGMGISADDVEVVSHPDILVVLDSDEEDEVVETLTNTLKNVSLTTLEG